MGTADYPSSLVYLDWPSVPREEEDSTRGSSGRVLTTGLGLGLHADPPRSLLSSQSWGWEPGCRLREERGWALPSGLPLLLIPRNGPHQRCPGVCPSWPDLWSQGPGIRGLCLLLGGPRVLQSNTLCSPASSLGPGKVLVTQPGSPGLCCPLLPSGI